MPAVYILQKNNLFIVIIDMLLHIMSPLCVNCIGLLKSITNKKVMGTACTNCFSNEVH